MQYFTRTEAINNINQQRRATKLEKETWCCFVKTAEERAEETGTQNQHSIKNERGKRGTCCMRKAKQTYKQQMNKANVKIKQRKWPKQMAVIASEREPDRRLPLGFGLGTRMRTCPAENETRAKLVRACSASTFIKNVITRRLYKLACKCWTWREEQEKPVDWFATRRRYPNSIPKNDEHLGFLPPLRMHCIPYDCRVYVGNCLDWYLQHISSQQIYFTHPLQHSPACSLIAQLA